MNLRVLPIAIAILSVFAIGMGAGPLGVTLYQVDDFQDGTTEGWSSGGGNPNPPSWVGAGGPLGAEDGFLMVEGNGMQTSGGNLVAFNTDQWAGDYLRAGVRGLRVDLRNLGSTALVVRLLFEGPGGGFYSTAAASLPPGGTWQTVHFTIEPSALTGGSDAEATLARVEKLRFMHAPTPDGPEPIHGTLGIDNITALSGDPCPDANLTRQALALCNAYCESLDCDGASPRASQSACAHLEAIFEGATEMVLPCLRPDLDGDGIEDEFDNCPAQSNPGQSDVDEDQVGDVCDNCPDDFNPEQEDLVGAVGVGDACDCPCFAVADVTAIATDPTCDPICVVARPTALNLAALQCSIGGFDFSAVVETFTDFEGEPLCQLNLLPPGESVVVVGLTDSQVMACQRYVLEAADASGLQCL